MAEMDPYRMNLAGVENLVASGINKTNDVDPIEEGVDGEYIDFLELPKSDEELIKLREGYEGKHNAYYPKIKPRQDRNKVYYAGKQKANQGDSERVVASNLIFEAQETFIPQALSNNPEPVVFSDNTMEGKAASNGLKTMLQYHADILCLRKKLGVMVRQWNIYFVGALKHGWDENVSDIKCELRRPQNFVFDPDGYVDEYGNFIGWLGERIETTAEKLVEMFPKHTAYIREKVDGLMGTSVTYTEWWTDEFTFSTYLDVVLDKSKNPYFNYGQVETDEGVVVNHFGAPKMPYTFLSVFSLQERPHDITNLIEQNVPNQDMINDRDDQITRNLRSSNNSLAVSMDQGFTVDIAHEAAAAIEDGDPVLTPGDIDKAIKRLPANALPSGILEAQQISKDTLRGIFGTQGLTAQAKTEDETARGMILNQSHDSSRIGGGIGDALEQVADNVFNWWAQLYSNFYDIKHYAAVMGTGQAVEYVSLTQQDFARKFVVSVSPNSMAPKDEVSEQNLAIQLADQGWLDPINLFKKLNYPDPMETAKMVTVFRVNPQLYLQMFFPQVAPPAPPGGMAPPNPAGAANVPPSNPGTLAAPPASPDLSQVPLPQ